jgi:hypothetical protein
MKKEEMAEEIERLDEELENKSKKVISLQMQAVLIGDVLEEFTSEDDQCNLSTIHGLIAAYHGAKEQVHSLIRDDINAKLAEITEDE